MLKNRVLLAVNIITAVGAVFANGANAPVVPSQNTKGSEVAVLNQSSLKSMESSWLTLPMSCKARGFFASPVTIESAVLNEEIASLYASFDA
jgi:hypothetical protein